MIALTTDYLQNDEVKHLIRSEYIYNKYLFSLTCTFGACANTKQLRQRERERESRIKLCK